MTRKEAIETLKLLKIDYEDSIGVIPALDLAIRELDDIENGIKAKAIRKRGTDKWYKIDGTSEEGSFPFFTRKFPDLWHPDFRRDGIEFTAEANFPSDAELVNVTILIL